MIEQTFVVVKNHEGQYSLWDAHRLPPAGWDVQTEGGDKESCLEYIRTHWTDMTPLSVKSHERALANK